MRQEPERGQILDFLSRPGVIVAFDISTDAYVLFDQHRKELLTLTAQLVYDLNIRNILDGKYRRSRTANNRRALAGTCYRSTANTTIAAPTFSPEAISIGARERESHREGELAERKAVFDIEHVISLASRRLASELFYSPVVPYDGIQTGEIEAVRCWAINRGQHSAWLESCFAPVIWEPDQVQTGDPSQPGEGVHAWKSMNGARDYAMTLFGGGSNVWGVVFGTVKLWGEVVEHEHGYRAQFAKIISLHGVTATTYTPCDADPYLSYFRQLYGVS